MKLFLQLYKRSCIVTNDNFIFMRDNMWNRFQVPYNANFSQPTKRRNPRSAVKYVKTSEG